MHRTPTHRHAATPRPAAGGAACALLAALLLLSAAPAAAQDTPAAAPATRDADAATTLTAEPADEAVDVEARKIVAPPGAPLTVADQDAPTTVAGPAVRMVDGKLVTDAEAEAAAVESMAQLIRQLNVARSPRAAGSREMDETTPTQLFDDKQVRGLLGDEPTVVYQVVYREEPIPDPMVVPWIRNVAVLRERFDVAVEMLSQGRVSQGREMLGAIVQEFPNTDYAAQASALIKKIDELQTPQEIQSLVATPGPREPDIVVDPNLSIGSVLYNPSDPAESRVMIGGRSYGVGDNPRGFSDHKIVNVTERSVEIEVTRRGNARRFTLPVGQPSAKR